MSLEHLIQLVRPGEPVRAGAPNRPLSQIHQNVEYLWDVISAAALGSTVYARQVTIAPEVLVGQPVYYDVSQHQFRPALAGVTTDVASGLLTTMPNSQVWGICAIKHNATLADLLLFGYAQVDLSAAIEGPVAPGAYYLSGQYPGQLVQQRPPVSIPVLRARDNGWVFVNPQFMDFLDSHRHYRFDLHCMPAGAHTPPEPGDRHTIENPNANWPGWLPADHPVFEGRAPANAVFGYNLERHPALRNAWPPIPLRHAYMEIDRAEDPDQGYHGIPLGPGGLAIIDRNGLWWLSDCWKDVPWPWNLYTDSSLVSASEELYDDFPPECPRESAMSLVLWFTRLHFATDAIVTSLVSLDDRIKIYCAGTNDIGATGDLEIDLDLNLLLGDDDRPGYLAMKELEDGFIHRGPVTSGLISGGSNVTLISQHQTNWNDQTVHHGRTTIQVLDTVVRELQPQLIRLMGATEEHYPALYLGLPPTNQSTFIVRFVIPTDLPDNYVCRYRATVLGRNSGGLPPLGIQYKRVSRPPDGLNTPITVVESYSPVTFNSVATVGTNQAIEALSEPFEIEAGEEVFIKVTRNPAEDSYPGECGIMKQTAVLSPTV